MKIPDTPPDLQLLSDDELRELAARVVDLSYEDRRRNQILTYKPASARCQLAHDSKARVLGIGGGNGSGKSESMIVDMIMSATGIFPHSQRHLIEQKFRGPIPCRMVVESLTTTLETIILPKLMWWQWTGVDRPGGERGHWGWVPQRCLLDGEWSKSWSAKLRVLRLLCRDPYDPDKVLGESTIQFMSQDQDSSDFASGDFAIVAHDEPPKLAQWRENEARTMRMAGRMMLAMTWPDDPSINVDWLYNEVYEPGKTGSDPNIQWLELWTTENQNLNQESVALQAGKWSAEMNAVRIYGRPIRFSNRIHPDFTDNQKTWCLRCQKSIIPVESKCIECGSEQIVEYNHVQDFETGHAWPTVFILDPHPRKPHMFQWIQITPSDDYRVIADGKADEDPVLTKKEVDRIESELGLFVVQRLTDPNMGLTSPGVKRGITWQREFQDAGLNLDLADDSSVGRSRINAWLKPDPHTLRPRLIYHPRCRDSIYQMMRFGWADFSKNVDRDQKQQPKDTYSDYPACTRYFANSGGEAGPSFRMLREGAPVLHTRRRHG